MSSEKRPRPASPMTVFLRLPRSNQTPLILQNKHFKWRPTLPDLHLRPFTATDFVQLVSFWRDSTHDGELEFENHAVHELRLLRKDCKPSDASHLYYLHRRLVQVLVEYNLVLAAATTEGGVRIEGGVFERFAAVYAVLRGTSIVMKGVRWNGVRWGEAAEEGFRTNEYVAKVEAELKLVIVEKSGEERKDVAGGNGKRRKMEEKGSGGEREIDRAGMQRLEMTVRLEELELKRDKIRFHRRKLEVDRERLMLEAERLAVIRGRMGDEKGGGSEECLRRETERQLEARLESVAKVIHGSGRADRGTSDVEDDAKADSVLDVWPDVS